MFLCRFETAILAANCNKKQNHLEQSIQNTQFQPIDQKIEETNASVVGMVGGHGGSSFGGQFVKLAGGDAFVNAGADFLSDQNGVAVIGAEAITKLLEARGYFVEVNRLLPPVPLYDIHFVISGDGV